MKINDIASGVFLDSPVTDLIEVIQKLLTEDRIVVDTICAENILYDNTANNLMTYES